MNLKKRDIIAYKVEPIKDEIIRRIKVVNTRESSGVKSIQPFDAYTLLNGLLLKSNFFLMFNKKIKLYIRSRNLTATIINVMKYTLSTAKD